MAGIDQKKTCLLLYIISGELWSNFPRIKLQSTNGEGQSVKSKPLSEMSMEELVKASIHVIVQYVLHYAFTM